MRLSEHTKTSIITVFEQIFQKGTIYLFGSRVDDQQKGGDIDLFVVPKSLDNIANKKIAFLVLLKQMIGEQKIDVVIDRGENRLIDRIAKQQGVLLCQKH
jgi:predicted nucleotidyltransferase